jgi:hypothetical protein
MTIRYSILLGPAEASWLKSLERTLHNTCRVFHSATRQAFIHDLRANTPSVIVLFDADADGVPNQPLLQYCAKYRPRSDLVFVHLGAQVRLPSSWCPRPHAVSHLILTADSQSRRATRIARFIEDLARRSSSEEARPRAHSRSSAEA